MIQEINERRNHVHEKGPWQIDLHQLVELIARESKIPASEILKENDDKLANYKVNIRKQFGRTKPKAV